MAQRLQRGHAAVGGATGQLVDAGQQLGRRCIAGLSQQRLHLRQRGQQQLEHLACQLRFTGGLAQGQLGIAQRGTRRVADGWVVELRAVDLRLRRGGRLAGQRLGELPQQFLQLRLIDGLGQVLIHPLGHQPLALARDGMGGDGDDRGLLVAPLLTNGLGRADAIEDRHLDIHEDQIEFQPLGQFDRLTPVLTGVHLGDQIAEHGGDQF